MLEKLRAERDAVLTGKAEKTAICRYQKISTYLFLPMGIALFLKGAPLLAAMFVFEALGQIIMARDNERTLKEGDEFYRYLPPTFLGRFSSAAFAGVALCRYILAATLSGNSLFIFAGVFLSVVFILITFTRRPDEIGGPLMFVAAAVAATVAWMHGAWSHAVFHTLYGLLLITGISLYRASRAEIMNIFFWIGLFIVFLASPHT